ncbi:chitinase-like protein Idgf5 isoform X3 [Bactrocera dorsalis]|uniref:Chitinase-like protein Idgf5 isoform X3 n=1 Tax=Bactrocera dorsalis TaxID=27457 RepID=A0ABM3JH15_BACDO|nr:chitinase-like protein Idgf5 isoform X3 [Bactrocera dorsalis]
MLKVTFLLITLLIASIEAAKMVCYYDSASQLREGPAKLTLQDLEPALQFCNYLVYGYAGIDPRTYQLKPLNKNLDITQNHYRDITNLRHNHPQLLILLSVGGDRDLFEESPSSSYLSVLENQAHRNSFINSALAHLKTYDFDGLDLAWQFPENPPKIVEGRFRSGWRKVKGWFFSSKPVDEYAAKHKEQFTTLVRELEDAFKSDALILSLTMLPHVDPNLYIDVPSVIGNVNFVNLGSYDFQTPERDPKVADHSAPIYEMAERDPTHNIDYQVQHWLNNSAPSNKIYIGVPAYELSWTMSCKSGITGYPPVKKTLGRGAAGKQLHKPGLMSWPEICEKLQADKELTGESAPLRKVGDTRQRYGSYAYRSADYYDQNGLWVSYEEPSTAAVKASYVSAKGLGGVALFDLSLDDFRGQCAGEKYPILRSIKFKL